MNNKKKFSLSLVMSSLMLSVATGCTYSGEEIEKETADKSNPYRSKIFVKNVDNYKVLQFTDLHWNTATNLELQKTFIRSCIEKADPDLIMVTGDSILNGTKEIAIALNDELNKIAEERTKQNHPTYFGYTWGNHDKQGSYNRSWLNDLAKSSKYSIYRDPGVLKDNVDGEGNYFIDILEGDEKSHDVAWRIYSLDSHALRNTNGHYDYDSISNNQIKWYMDQANDLKRENGGKLTPSLNFFHICIPEYLDSFYSYNESLGKTKYDDEYELKGNVIGYLGEHYWKSKSYSKPVYDKKTNKLITTEPVPFHGAGSKLTYKVNGQSMSFFNIAKDNGCVGMSVGHDHANDWVSQYKDVILGYGVKTGKELYYAAKNSTDGYGNIISPATKTDGQINGLQWYDGRDEKTPKKFDHTGATLFTLHPKNTNSAGNLGTFDIEHLYIDTDDITPVIGLGKEARQEQLSKKWLTQKAFDLPKNLKDNK